VAAFSGPSLYVAAGLHTGRFRPRREWGGCGCPGIMTGHRPSRS